MLPLHRLPRPELSSPSPQFAQARTRDRSVRFGWIAVAVSGLVVAGTASARSWLSSHLVPSPATTPTWWGTTSEVVAEAGVSALLALCVILGLRALRRGPGEAARCLVAAGATVAAYLVSEGLKVLFAQQRPCQLEQRLIEVSACPVVTDYAFPSNHATVSAALAAAAVLMLPRSWPPVTVAVLTVGLARFLGGVHYLHDVLAGALLGSVVVFLAAALLGRPAAAVLARAVVSLNATGQRPGR